METCYQFIQSPSYKSSGSGVSYRIKIRNNVAVLKDVLEGKMDLLSESAEDEGDSDSEHGDDLKRIIDLVRAEDGLVLGLQHQIVVDEPVTIFIVVKGTERRGKA